MILGFFPGPLNWLFDGYLILCVWPLAVCALVLAGVVLVGIVQIAKRLCVYLKGTFSNLYWSIKKCCLRNWKTSKRL